MKVFERSRRIAATPEAIWPFVDDVSRWPDWFTEAESAEVLEGSGPGRRQRMRGHDRAELRDVARPAGRPGRGRGPGRLTG